ncbi:MAG: outer membrane lipoprotein-sorting protein [Lutibacter sp.]|uniref:outer membrane lipoprotein-sorting protein n=1 Tax=Lutibacter sp. TaxID=1925666 RepID=UPI00299D3A26|nr:outer membrane lipoprotein-sorting protein [Lutibacter sp.]MDX1829862.1 outer membrane lipoprotein-sorting protein [Lutibacter sp.]
MKLKTLFIILLIFAIGSVEINAQENLTASEIVQKSDELIRGKTNTSIVNMEIIRPTWKRTIGIKSWGRGQDYSMDYITSPAQDKGQVFLKLKTEMWNYIPAIGRMIKIPASMLSQGWMGSDYTNDDILKQSSIVVDYNHKLIDEETVNGYKSYKIEMTPKEDAAVVWGKIIMWIIEDNFIQIKTEFYDEDNDLVKSEFGYDFKNMGGRLIPTRIEIVPANEEGKKTVLYIKEMKFNIDLPATFFSQQNMKRVH